MSRLYSKNVTRKLNIEIGGYSVEPSVETMCDLNEASKKLSNYAIRCSSVFFPAFLTARMKASWKQFWRLKQIKLFVKGGTK